MVSPRLVFAVAICTTGLFAGPCVPDLLSNYEALGSGGCSVGPFNVKSFSYTLISSTVTIADTDITVTPIFGLGSFGLTFSSTKFDVSGTDSAKYLLAYTWDPGTVRSLEDILNTSTPVAPGFAQISTDACVDAAFSGASCSTFVDTIVVNHDGITPNLNASVAFSPTIGTVGIRNTIELDANGASSEFKDFSNILFVPEPSTVIGGLFAAALAFRRSRR